MQRKEYGRQPVKFKDLAVMVVPDYRYTSNTRQSVLGRAAGAIGPGRPVAIETTSATHAG